MGDQQPAEAGAIGLADRRLSAQGRGATGALVRRAQRSRHSRDAAGLVDQAVFIPMRGMVQSLNVSVAAATLLFEALRQRRASGLLPTQGKGLPAALYQQRLFEWAYPEVAAWCRQEGRAHPPLDAEGAIAEEVPRTLRLRC